MIFTGGILFSLLLEIKNDSPRAQRLDGNKNSCTNPELLKKLIDLIGLEATKKPSPEVTSRFKTCQANGAGNGINSKNAKTVFDERIRNHYAELHRMTKEILESDIMPDDESRRNIVSVMLDTIKRCQNIKNGTLLYTNENGEQETLSDLLTRDTINFPALILGLWHFTISTRCDNKTGEEMFYELFEMTGEIGTTYQLCENLRNMQRANLRLTYDDSTAVESENTEEETEGVNRKENELRVENPGLPAQTITFSFSVTGDKANVRNIINHGVYIEGDYNEK